LVTNVLWSKFVTVAAEEASGDGSGRRPHQADQIPHPANGK
jgi:hypothetical protein